MSTVTFEYAKTNPLLTLSLYPAILGYGLSPPDETEGCKRYLALTGSDVFFALGAVVGVVETVFWAAIFLIAKTVHLFIPKSCETATFICSLFFGRTMMALIFTVVSTQLIYNSFATETEKGAMSKAAESAIDAGVKKYEDCLNYQLFDC